MKESKIFIGGGFFEIKEKKSEKRNENRKKSSMSNICTFIYLFMVLFYFYFSNKYIRGPTAKIYFTREPVRRKAATGYCGNRSCGFQKGTVDKHSSRLIKSFRRIDGELIFLAQPKWQCHKGDRAVAEVIPLFCSAQKWQQ